MMETGPPVQIPAPARAKGKLDIGTISRNYAGSIVESMFGPIEWLDADTGYCRCPAERLHTHSTGKRDCEVFLRGVPTLYCFHTSCSGVVAEANHKLRSAVAKIKNAGFVDARWEPSPADIAGRTEKENADKLKARAKASLSYILAQFPVCLPGLWETSPVRLDGDLRHEWQLHLQLFSPDDVVWIGDKYDSAKETAAEWKKAKAARHFRPVSEWLKEPLASDNFTSPAVWKPGTTSRCNEAVKERKFLVTESDSLKRSEMLSLIAWCRQFMLLRAIIDTGGKSLHGWFDFPDERTLTQLKLIAGGSKSFKTWLALDLALSIACGVSFLKRNTTQQKVLYVNLELRPVALKRRIQTIAKAKDLSVHREFFYHLSLRGKLASLLTSVTISRVIELTQRFGARVVVIDPIYKLNQGDENSSRDQTIFFNELDRLTTEAKCTLILNDHFGKGNQSEKDPLDAIRGSSAKGGDVDAALILRRHDLKDCFRVDVVQRELQPVEPFCIGWQYPLFELRPDLDPEKMRKPKAGRKPEHDPRTLLRAISHTSPEHSVSVSEWAGMLDMNRNTLNGYVSDFRSQGWIGTVGEGKQARRFITQKGREQL